MNQWTTVRLFVSSTFKDMDVERDALRNIVIPRLNDFFIGFQTSVQLVDLRHSVETSSEYSPKEREERVFSFCMDEIDACLPFFLGLVGHRYGWIPTDVKQTREVFLPEDFPLGSDQLSVTVCEFLHAFKKTDSSSRALVLMRDEKSYSTFTAEEIKDFVDKGEEKVYIDAFRNYLSQHKQEFSVDEPYILNQKDLDGTEIEGWSKHVFDLLKSRILQHIGNPDSLAEETFFKEQQAFINRHILSFVGREKVIEECIKYLKHRGMLYLFQPQHGMGQTALLCKLYSLLSDDPGYFCLFNSWEASKDGSNYEYVFYYWDLQLLRFLGRDTDYLKSMKGKTIMLYDEFCRLCESTFSERQVRVAVFEEDSYPKMGDHFGIKQAHNCHIQSINAEKGKSVKMLAPYVLGNLLDEDFGLLTKSLRKAVIPELRAKKQAKNVKWLSLAVNILNSLNKLDYKDIRSKDGLGDNEQNINNYLAGIVYDMPDSYEALCYFWFSRLQIVLGEGFVNTYIGVTGVSKGLTDDDLANITGRDVDWCTYFKHLLGKSIIQEDHEGYISLREEFVQNIIEKWPSDYRKELSSKVYEYIKGLSSTSPTYRRNIFAVAMGTEDFETCLSYISDKDNYRYFINDCPAMIAFDQKSRYHRDEYLYLVSQLVNMAPINYDTFHGLNLWCELTARRHEYTLYLKTASYMISKLEDANSKGELDSQTAMALVEIYDRCGGCYVELPFGEEKWDRANQRQMVYCLAHINESLDWNALLMSAIYDRFEGFGIIRQRWEYLKEVFLPLEIKGLDYDDRHKFVFYVRLLRETAILMARFDSSQDPKPYAIKALEVSTSLKDKQIQKQDKEVNVDNILLQWIWSAWLVYRLMPKFRHPDINEVRSQTVIVLNEMKKYADRYFGFKAYSVVYAQLSAEYAMDLCHTDATAAMRVLDDSIDLLMMKNTPDDALKIGVSQKNITFMTQVGCFQRLGNETSYSDISLAWVLVARSYIRIMADKHVPSGFTRLSEELDAVLRLSSAHTPNKWDRQSDPAFVLLTAIYVKILDDRKKNWPDKAATLRLFNQYMDLFDKSSVHYRYSDFRQLELVRQLHKEMTETRTAFSPDDLEQLIDKEDYDTIIQNLCVMESGSKEEFFYLGLAYLRKGQYADSIKLYRILLDIDGLPEGFCFSCKVNYLYALLASGQRDVFSTVYRQLSREEQEDSDVQLIYQAFSDSLNYPDDTITLQKPYGFKL